jgi:membrane protease YdiL (CAAX protease family)
VVNDPGYVLLLVVLQDTVFLVLTLGLFWVGVSVLRGLGRPVRYSLAPLGFSKPNRGYLAGTWLGFLVGLGTLLMSFLVLPLSVYVVEWLGYSAERTVQEPFMQSIQEWVGERSQIAIPAAIAVIVLFAPAVEEIIFRGALFGGLYHLGRFISSKLRKKRDGKSEGGVSFVLATLVSSAAFALPHLEPVLLPTLFVLAIALCGLYRKTGSLFSSFVAHATFNSFAVLVIVLSGLGTLPTQV